MTQSVTNEKNPESALNSGTGTERLPSTSQCDVKRTFERKFDYLLIDEPLYKYILAVRSGDQHAFRHIEREFEADIRIIASKLFIIGADAQDVIQEALIGLHKAVKDYDPSKKNFRNFAHLCMRRQVYTAISMSQRQYNVMLNHSMLNSLDEPLLCDDSDAHQTLMDIVPDDRPDALSMLIREEEVVYNVSKLRQRLTQMEDQVLLKYQEDKSYKQIGREIGMNQKAADNSLIRIRRKALEVYEEYEKDTAANQGELVEAAPVRKGTRKSSDGFRKKGAEKQNR